MLSASTLVIAVHIISFILLMMVHGEKVGKVSHCNKNNGYLWIMELKVI